EFILNSSGNLFHSFSPKFRHHSARFQDSSKQSRTGGQDSFQGSSHLAGKCIPSLAAGGVTRRISAMPPNQEQVWIGRPAGLRLAVKGFELVKNLRKSQSVRAHGRACD